MLILTRRVGEDIIIELLSGEEIKVAVLGVKGNQVRIGTQAPDDIQKKHQCLETVVNLLFPDFARMSLNGRNSPYTPIPV